MRAAKSTISMIFKVSPSQNVIVRTIARGPGAWISDGLSTYRRISEIIKGI